MRCRKETGGRKGRSTQWSFRGLFAHLPSVLAAILLIPTLWYLFKEGRRYSVIVDLTDRVNRSELEPLLQAHFEGASFVAIEDVQYARHGQAPGLWLLGRTAERPAARWTAL
jgi:hypothetical protein